jgi:ComF family protein
MGCTESLPKIASTMLPISKKSYLTVHAISNYEGTLRRLILQKNSGRWRQFSALARIAHKHLNLKNLKPDCFIPVPLHWTRELWRGYNQAAILAKEYANLANVPVLDCLSRSRKTPFQSTLNKESRETNVKKAFAIKQDHFNALTQNITGKHIVLVDDVMTTGATLVEMARLLNHYEPAKITALVVCRVT